MARVSKLEVRNVGKLRPENTFSCFLNVIGILIITFFPSALKLQESIPELTHEFSLPGF